MFKYNSLIPTANAANNPSVIAEKLTFLQSFSVCVDMELYAWKEVVAQVK